MKVEKTDNVAVSILYKTEDLAKLLPPFVNQLNVPLIAIADAVNNDEMIYLRDKSEGCHFTNMWQFTEEGYRATGPSSEGDG